MPLLEVFLLQKCNTCFTCLTLTHAHKQSEFQGPFFPEGDHATPLP